jgi:excisionase family DNA binding protein
MPDKPVDPFKYIEEAFERAEKGTWKKPDPEKSPTPTPVTPTSRAVVEAVREASALPGTPKAPSRRRKGKAPARRATAPRPRARPHEAPAVIPKELERVWAHLPKNLEFLLKIFDDSITRKYYSSGFKESREELIQRLIDPQLTLEETARLLGVCPTTIRRYTNRGWLKHLRTPGNQRRFKLSHIVEFVEAYGLRPE